MKFLFVAVIFICAMASAQSGPPDRDLIYPTFPPKKVQSPSPPLDFVLTASTIRAVNGEKLLAEADELILTSEKSFQSKDVVLAKAALQAAQKKLRTLSGHARMHIGTQTIAARTSAIDALLMKMQ